MWTAKVQASLCIRAVSPEPMLFAQISGRPRGKFSQRTRHEAILRDLACTLKDWFEWNSQEHFSLDTTRIVIILILYWVSVYGFDKYLTIKDFRINLWCIWYYKTEPCRKKPLRKHAYSNILTILQPKRRKFSDKKLLYFSYFGSKHRLWVLVRTASARRF